MSLNKCMLIGNLGKDPKMVVVGGQAKCEFALATSENLGPGDKRTEWHTIVTWGKTAENCAKYLTKGRSVYVEGRLQTRSWVDKDGRSCYKTEIIASNVEFLGSREASPVQAQESANDDQEAAEAEANA